MTTNPDLDQAREWAKSNLDKGHFAYGGRVMAAAHVIASLPDEWIDANKLREIVEAWGQRFITSDADLLLRDLRGLLPATTPRTLADMTPEEREACQWMQCELEGDDDERPVIIWADNSESMVVFPDGRYARPDLEHVVPLPDFPRMVWPEDEATEEDMSIIPPEIDTSTGHDDFVDMAPEDVPEGEAWLIRPYENADPTPAFRFHGSQYGPRKRWAHYVTGSSMLRFEDDENITLVSRLVPEVTE